MTKVLVFGAQLVSQRRKSSGDWTRSFYSYDGHGGVRLLTDDSGLVTDSYDYDAFGNLLSSTGSTSNDYRYVGERFDASLGTIDLRARKLNPATGRFISADPWAGDINRPETLNRYTYAAADPVDQIDPLGTASLWQSARWGVTVHRVIGTAFVSQLPTFRYSDRRIDTVLGAPLPYGTGWLRPDLVDSLLFEVYEIKPKTQITAGQIQLIAYLGLMTGWDPLHRLWHPGYTWEYPLGIVPLGGLDIAQVYPSQFGVIPYEVIPLNNLVQKGNQAQQAELEEETESAASFSAALGGLLF